MSCTDPNTHARDADTQAQLERFFTRLRAAERAVLFLDYDGTLAPFHRERDRALPYPGVRAKLDRLQALARTRLVIISGRATEDLLPLLALARTPEVWGSHGWERLHADGRYEIGAPDSPALRALAEADSWAAEVGALGAELEQKPACLAVHWRGRPPEVIERVRAQVRENWALRGRPSGLELHEFNGGLELRVPGRDKGYAVSTVLGEEPAADAAAIAYLGDDLTDEDAFRALDGRGLKVLVRDEARSTHADLRIVPPDELLAFLARWVQCDEEKQ